MKAEQFLLSLSLEVSWRMGASLCAVEQCYHSCTELSCAYQHLRENSNDMSHLKLSEAGANTTGGQVYFSYSTSQPAPFPRESHQIGYLSSESQFRGTHNGCVNVICEVQVGGLDMRNVHSHRQKIMEFDFFSSLRQTWWPSASYFLTLLIWFVRQITWILSEYWINPHLLKKRSNKKPSKQRQR